MAEVDVGGIKMTKKEPNSSPVGTHRLVRELKEVSTSQVTKSAITEGEAIWKNQCQGIEMEANGHRTEYLCG